MSLDSYKELKKYKVNISTLLEWHFSTIICSVSRKLTLKQKFRNPWEISICSLIHRDIFFQAYRAIRDFHIEYGRTVQVTKDKKGDIKLIRIIFTHFGALKYHLHQLSGEKLDIVYQFSKIAKPERQLLLK